MISKTFHKILAWLNKFIKPQYKSENIIIFRGEMAKDMREAFQADFEKLIDKYEGKKID